MYQVSKTHRNFRTDVHYQELVAIKVAAGRVSRALTTDTQRSQGETSYQLTNQPKNKQSQRQECVSVNKGTNH